MKRSLIAASACVVLAASARSQDSFGPNKGESLLSVSGAYSYTSFDEGVSDQQRLTIGSAIGYFLTDEHEIGGALAVDLFNDDDLGSPEIIDLGPYYNYNYRANPRTWLYGGVHAGYLFADKDGSSSDSAVNYGVQAGIRHWLTPTTSIFVEPRYTHYTEFFDTDRDEFQTRFGLSVTL